MAEESRYDREPAGWGYGRERDEYRGPDYGRGEYRGRAYGRDEFERGGYHGEDYRRGYGYDYGREDRDYGGRGYGREGRDYGYGDYRREDYGRRGLGYGRPGYGYGGYGGTGYGREGAGYGGYGREDYGRRSGEDYGSYYYGRERDYGGYGRGGSRGYRGGRGEERGFMDRASDEAMSWFGDENAERRRSMDEQRGGYGAGYGEHRGRGPRNYTRSDDRIREDVNDRLSDDPMVDASNIEVRVSNGEVTLDGTVNSRWDKRRAEDIADDISGVKHVQNNLRVQQQSGTTGALGQTGTTGQTATPTAANESSTGRSRSSAA